MAPSRLAVETFARLCSHWPALGGDDLAAEIRARDWCATIDRTRPEVAVEVCEQLVTGWARAWPPRIADWQDLARQVAVRIAVASPPRSLPAAPVDAARVEELVARARAALDAAQRRQYETAPPRRMPHPARDRPVASKPIDPEGRWMPTYEQIYEEDA